MHALEIRALRTGAGWSSLRLAQHLGVAQSLVLDWESGIRFPTRQHSLALAELKAALASGSEAAPVAAAEPEAPSAAELADLIRRLCTEPALWQAVKLLLESPRVCGPHGVSEPAPLPERPANGSSQ